MYLGPSYEERRHLTNSPTGSTSWRCSLDLKVQKWLRRGSKNASISMKFQLQLVMRKKKKMAKLITEMSVKTMPLAATLSMENTLQESWLAESSERSKAMVCGAINFTSPNQTWTKALSPSSLSKCITSFPQLMNYSETGNCFSLRWPWRNSSQLSKMKFLFHQPNISKSTALRSLGMTDLKKYTQPYGRCSKSWSSSSIE